jgi:IrrE N-terminal-like domain
MTASNPYFLNLSENPRSAALRVLSDGSIDTVPVDLARLAKRHDWSLNFEDFGDPDDKRRDGRFEIDGNEQISIFINTQNLDDKDGFSTDPVQRLRQRFSMAHEIGHAHFKTHRDKQLQNKLSPENNPLHGKQYGYERESQANEFASELLMPQWDVLKQLKTLNWDNFFAAVETLAADTYDVSFMSCALRFAKEAPFPAMCLYFNSAYKLAQVPARSRDHKDTGFFFESKTPIPQRTLAHDVANDLSCITWSRKQSNCKNWFGGSKNADKYELREQVRRLGSYGLLVFLSFNEKEIEY